MYRHKFWAFLNLNIVVLRRKTFVYVKTEQEYVVNKKVVN